MSEWHTLTRITLCDDQVEHDVRTDGLADRSDRYECKLRTDDDGRMLVFLPRALAPPFEERDRFCVASADGEVLCSQRIESSTDVHRGDVPVRSYACYPP